jgi:hypothetical protein
VAAPPWTSLEAVAKEAVKQSEKLSEQAFELGKEKRLNSYLFL